MSKYLIALKEVGALDFENNSIDVKKVLVDKVKRTFFITAVIKNALKTDEYLNFIKKNDEIFEKLNASYDINVTYENKALSTEELLAYYNMAIDNVSKKSPFVLAFKEFKIKVDENNIIVLVDNISKLHSESAAKIQEELLNLFVDFKILIEESEEAKEEVRAFVEDQKERDAEAIEQIMENAREAEAVKELAIKKEKNYKHTYEVVKIESIPKTNEEIYQYKNTIGDPVFKLVGKIFKAEVRALKKVNLLEALITDNTDSIMIKKFLRGEEQIKNSQAIIEKVEKGKLVEVEVTGKAEYDDYARGIVFMATDIQILGVASVQFPKDEAKVKRVELAAHTKMSNLDGLSEAADYINCAEAMGHKAIGFTDHNGVYCIPDISHALKKDSQLKPLYGCDFDYIDDEELHITYTNDSIALKEAKYVVFDIEATGLSQNYDEIIEISAYKVYENSIVETYETFIDPKFHIPAKITEITSITDDMVKGAPGIKEAIEGFLKFSEGCILVAHNADYDIGMIHAKMRQNGIEDYPIPGIDTLALFRALHYDTEKRFGLKYLSKFYKVKQEHHHRASDDTRVLAECFMPMLQDVYERDIYDYKDLNTLLNNDEVKRTIIPHRMSVLAKTQAGYKNLFKLVSDALTVHVANDAVLLRSVLNTLSDGIITLSGNTFGDVFDSALNKSEDDLRRCIKKYDVIEVQPPLACAHIVEDLNDGHDGNKIIEEVISKIIRVAKEEGKIVCATSECYYIFRDDRKYRDILIDSPKVGGGRHELAGYKVSPYAHIRTTDEMLSEFKFLDPELAYEIVVTNTNAVADSIDVIRTFHKEMFVPADDEFADHEDPNLRFPSMIEGMKSVIKENMQKKYGDNIHPYVQARIDRESKSIISSGYYSTYFMAYLMVKDSLDHGYLVGSRGSVGSSFAATMMNITEVNPLPPHYLCPHCKFMAIKFHPHEEDNIYTEEERALQPTLRAASSGFDLPDMNCPRCSTPMKKDGQDIPFETFLGFNGDKVPDIDLNFSGEYQPTAHLFVRKMMGYDNSFRGGTVGTIADKNGYGYVKAYLENKGMTCREYEVDRISRKITGIRRSTGQHPGGIVVVPKRIDIYDVTPIQYPANDRENPWRTTHFDYHAFEDNLLKLDVLGHDDPTLIKYFMDIVHEHQDEFPFSDPRDIPLDDRRVFGLFGSTESIGVKPEDISSEVASFAVPELGTNFVRQMLLDTKPKTFAELVKISGLSHGTGVWLGNAKELVDPSDPKGFGVIPFEKIIGCRDDIMVDLIAFGMDPLKSFKIMEFVRKGKLHKNGGDKDWEPFRQGMVEANVPPYYIWACEQIEYMFPKAHAVAYVIMALRIAWFKVYKPALFYSAYLSKRAKAHSVEGMLQSTTWIKNKILELQAIKSKTAKDEDLITSLQVVLEAKARGINFLPIDIFKSDSITFTIEGDLEKGDIRIPFVAFDGLGESAAEKIKESRNERLFTSKKDIEKRKIMNKTLFDKFEEIHAFGLLPDDDPDEEVGLFAL